MSLEQPGQIKMLFQSIPNLVFIGVMAFLALAIHAAFLFILVAGELGLLLLAQTAGVQRLLRARTVRDWVRDHERTEKQILAGLGETYKGDFLALRALCGEIESRTRELGPDQPLMQGVVEKLYGLRLEYIRMLRAHFLLANRNYSQIQERLDKERASLEADIKVEKSDQVRSTKDQHVQVLRQRIAKASQLNELVRLIEARLKVVGDSLQLIQDEVYSMTDVRDISGVVDELLVKLAMNDEFRTYYGDLLQEGSQAFSGLGTLMVDDSEAELSPRRDGSASERLR